MPRLADLFRAPVSGLIGFALIAQGVSAQTARRPLSTSDVDDIARLVMLEDHREYHAADLERIYKSQHPEVRRRAALAIGRLADKRGIAILRAAPLDADTAVAATAVFAIGQMHDSTMIAWFDSLLANNATPSTVAKEAAIALGKLPAPASRTALARYLTRIESNANTDPAIGEALLSIGRTNIRGDLAPIIRWTHSPSEEIRWRATWALFRPRDPAAVATLLDLMRDQSGHVRSWAVRSLTKPTADSAGLGARAETAIVAATRDADRRVSTEAIRTLGGYSDTVAVATLVRALTSKDSWISTSAAEGLGRIKSPGTVRGLVAATEQTKSCALRIVAMQALQMFAPTEALAAAMGIVRDENPYCRATAAAALTRAAPTAGSVASVAQRATLSEVLDAFRAETREHIDAKDVLTRVATFKTMATWADASDLPALRAALARAQAENATAAVNAATAAITATERRVVQDSIARAGGGASAGGGRGAGGGGRGRPAPPVGTRSLAEYKAIVEHWIVPDYNGTPRPTAEWETPRGKITLELYPGDTPLAVDDFVKTMDAGSILGAQFTRVVPDFVDQQETIRSGNTLRDEVNRLGLTRNNLAWATAGLDTGSPGYTLGHTPQPHNEGNFTPMGRVIRGAEAMDRIELGDRILSARMVKR